MSGVLAVAILGASAMLTLALGLWLPAYERDLSIRRRLKGFVQAGLAGGLGSDLGGRRRSRVGRTTAQAVAPSLVQFLESQIARSGADITAVELGGAVAILAIAGLVIGIAFAPPYTVVAGGALGAALPFVWLRRRHARLQRRFNDDLADTIELLASSVRAGHSLLQGFEHVASEAAEPTRGAFALVVREIGVGASQENALERLRERFPSEDMDVVVTAINVHHQIGGSLSKVLDIIAATMRERARVAADIRGLTAQQRFSSYVLTALPFAVAGLLFVVSPDYMSVVFESNILRVAMLAAGGLALLGFLVMKRMAAIDV